MLDKILTLNGYFHFFFFALFLLSLLTASIASCNRLSANLAVSMNPMLVFPKEFGPAEVMVSLPTFLILILALSGICSSSSESESWLNAAATDTDPGFLGLSDMEQEPTPPPPPSFIANGFVDFLKEKADDDCCFGEVFDQGGVFEDMGAGAGGGDGEGESDGSLTNFGADFEGGGPGGRTPEGGGGGGPLGNDPGGGGGGGAEGRIPGGGGGGGPAPAGGLLSLGGGGGGGVPRTSHRLRPLFAWMNSPPPSSDFLFLPPPSSSISRLHLTHTLKDCAHKYVTQYHIKCSLAHYRITWHHLRDDWANDKTGIVS